MLGVRLSTDEDQSAQLLERLIHDHRYSVGFSLVPQGTPTNVTSEADAPPEIDPDDMLKWLRGKGAYADDGKQTKLEDECDGLRLAHALGIAPESLRYVMQADGHDAAEAMAMKRALWAGTLGYYGQQMLSPLFENGDRRAADGGRPVLLHAFRIRPGAVPAIRVGNQPYGVLPVSSDGLQPSADAAGEWGDQFLDQFTSALHGKLTILARAWLDAVPQLLRAGAGSAADARLVDVLSMQAIREDHTERLLGPEVPTGLRRFQEGRGTDASGVRAKAPGACGPDHGWLFGTVHGQPADARFDVLRGVVERHLRGRRQPGPWGGGSSERRRHRRSPVLGVAHDRGVPDDRGHIPELHQSHGGARLCRDPPGTDADQGRQVHSSHRHVVRAPAAQLPVNEHAFGAMRLYHHLQDRPWREFREKELYNVLFVPDTTVLGHPGGGARPTWERLGLGDERMTALKLLRTRGDLRDRVPQWDGYLGDVDELYRSLHRLQGLPTARLERLFAEHIDLCSYRLDAWLTGLAYQRVLAHRIVRADSDFTQIPLPESFNTTVFVRDPGPLRYDLNGRPIGSYACGIILGAFGWVESLTPDAPGSAVADLPDDLKPRNGGGVTRDSDNHGLIHAPSLNQAATAALLRAASVSEPDTTAFNIDLSSARVREALWIIDGVRNGQTPAALLGYKFERALREADPILLQHLPALRGTFPVPRPAETEVGPTESIPARDVVNGLRLIQAHREGTLDALILPFMTVGAERTVVARLAAGLLDSLDACSDLMLAESVHQASQGNYDRAGGVVTAAGEFTHVPDAFDVIDTPRSGTSITHRLVIALNQLAAPVTAATPRQRLAPELNNWLGALLGNCRGWRATSCTSSTWGTPTGA